MATYYYNSNATTNGDGLTPATPFNVTINTGSADGLAFGVHTWYLFAGSVWDLGSGQGTTGNNTQLLKFGTGANPIITSSNTTRALNIATANNVTITNVDFVKNGATAGQGITGSQVGNATTPGLTITGSSFSNFTTGIDVSQSDNCTITSCTFNLQAASTGIVSWAFNGQNVTNLRIINNTFNGGAGINLRVSDTTDTAGNHIGLIIRGNTFNNIVSTAILMRCAANSISSTAQTSVAVGGLITRDSAWPISWGVGKKIFLGGFTDPTNFGIFTVVSVVGTLLTVSEPTAFETLGLNKGIYLISDTQAFINPQIINNTINNCAQTPMLIDNFVGGLISGNKIYQSRGSDISASGIEMLAFKNTVVEFNYINGVKTTGAVDGMGIFADGGCDGCVIRFNTIENLVGTDRTNSGAGIASFYARNCQFYSNVVNNCKNGYWGGGTAGNGITVFQNTFGRCRFGYFTESNTFPNNATVTSNLFAYNTFGLSDSATSTIAGNAYWKNTTDSATGVLSAKDATAVTADPLLGDTYQPLTGSPLLGVVPHTTYRRDVIGRQRYNPSAIGAYDRQVARGTRV